MEEIKGKVIKVTPPTKDVSSANPHAESEEGKPTHSGRDWRKELSVVGIWALGVALYIIFRLVVKILADKT